MGQLFSKRNKEVFSAPLGIDNPVTVQVLGICSALAVTAKLEPAIVMGLSVTVITAFANVVISLLRKTIPNRIRIIVQLVVVAALVTIVSEVLKAYASDVSVQLSVYVGLIITNCILMGRLEAFAMQNGPWESFLDGVGTVSYTHLLHCPVYHLAAAYCFVLTIVDFQTVKVIIASEYFIIHHSPEVELGSVICICGNITCVIRQHETES